ncbi:MAG: hypothetical protein AAF219_01330 [Myxococcota bacterium]
MLILIHLCATLFMTGVIWFVQVVHYPLFVEVGPERFAQYEALHTSRTSTVVIPAMLTELAAAMFLLIAPPPAISRVSPAIGLALLALIWLTTALASVPAHAELAGGFSAAAHTRLVATNWIRTTGWSCRTIVAVWITAQAISSSTSSQ